MHFTHKERLSVGCLVLALIVGSITMSLRGAHGAQASSNTVSGMEIASSSKDDSNPKESSLATPQAAKAVEDTPVVVHVGGAVEHPGVYTLAASSRVVDAIRIAGGATKGSDLDALNLAAHISDGEKIFVPTIGQVPSSTASPQATVKQSSARTVNVNTATTQELESLPGVGPALAQRITEYRTTSGAIKSLSDLDAVSGIGPKMLDKLKGLVSF